MTETLPEISGPFYLICHAFLKLDALLLGGTLPQNPEHLSIEKRHNKVVFTLNTGAVAFLDKEGRRSVANRMTKMLLDQGITDIKVLTFYDGAASADRLDEANHRRHGILDNDIQVIVTVPESADSALKIEAAHRCFIVNNIATTLAAYARELSGHDPASFMQEVVARAQEQLPPTVPAFRARGAGAPGNDSLR